MVGLGYRREMAGWNLPALGADFYEVAPENWVQRDRAPLLDLVRDGFPVHLHGVSLNLGGQSDLDDGFLKQVAALMDELGAVHYSDHLAASGDAHQLYDLFPVPLTPAEVRRVGDRIRHVQDRLGRRIGVENTTWYTNTGTLPEPAFLAAVLEHADCHLLLDLNNVAVNHKNHGGLPPEDFVRELDLGRVSYLHVAGHEFDARFGLHIDTHSQPVEPATADLARQLNARHGLPILLEWDNDLPDATTFQRELAWLRSTTT